jgi:rRNA-processing protein FCF1
MGLTLNTKVVNMAVNICEIIMKSANHSANSNVVVCTNDIELYVHMLTCPR